MGLLDFMQTPEGQGLLAATFGGLAGARKGAPINSIGRAGLAGLQGYSGAIDQQSQVQTQADQRKYREMQMTQMQNEFDQRTKRQQGVQDFVKSIDPTISALSNGQGPTIGNAANAPDAKTLQYFNLLKNGLVDPVDYIKATGPKDVEIKEYQQVRLPDNSVQLVGLTKDGKVVNTNQTPFIKPEIRDFGGSYKGIDLITGKKTDLGNKTQSPDSIASNSLGWANNNLAKKRFTFEQGQAVKPVFNADIGGFITAPSDMKPGEVRKVVGTPGIKLTEDQAKATGWLSQATNAYDNIKAVIENNPSAVKPGFADAVSAIPSFGMGGAVGNMMRGEDRQKFIQGASSLSESLLRAATGAGVNKEEAEQKVRELTPVFGDGDAVIKQKMDAIPIYLETLKVRSGPGASKLPEIMSAKGRNSAMSPGGWSASVVK